MLKRSKKVELDEQISNILEEYIDKDFKESYLELDTDIKKVFKRFKEYEYKGLYSQLGIWQDLRILYDIKDKK